MDTLLSFKALQQESPSIKPSIVYSHKNIRFKGTLDGQPIEKTIPFPKTELHMLGELVGFLVSHNDDLIDPLPIYEFYLSPNVSGSLQERVARELLRDLAHKRGLKHAPSLGNTRELVGDFWPTLQQEGLVVLE